MPSRQLTVHWQTTMLKFHKESDFHLAPSQNCLLGVCYGPSIDYDLGWSTNSTHECSKFFDSPLHDPCHKRYPRFSDHPPQKVPKILWSPPHGFCSPSPSTFAVKESHFPKHPLHRKTCPCHVAKISNAWYYCDDEKNTASPLLQWVSVTTLSFMTSVTVLYEFPLVAVYYPSQSTTINNNLAKSIPQK